MWVEGRIDLTGENFVRGLAVGGRKPCERQNSGVRIQNSEAGREQAAAYGSFPG